MIHPACQRLQALGLGAVIDLAALRALDDEACLAQRLQMLRDGALGDTAALRQVADADLADRRDALEDGAARRVREGSHDGVDGGGFAHTHQLAMANALVNAN